MIKNILSKSGKKLKLKDVYQHIQIRYSNNVYIPGHHTVPDDMEQPWVTCNHQVEENHKVF